MNMKKIFLTLLLGLLGWVNILAQDTLSFKPEGFRPPWLLLRMLYGGKALYLQAADSIPQDGYVHFILENQPTGEYALQFDVNEPRGFRFIYHGQSMKLHFDKKGQAVSVEGSKENQIYFAFRRQYDSLRKRIKNLEKQYARQASPALKKEYIQTRKQYYALFDRYAREARGLFAAHLIAAHKDAFPPEPLTSLNDYVRYDEAHYFDYTPMNDSVLIQSNVLTDRIMRYVFRMPVKGYGKDKTDAYLRRMKNIFDRLTYPPMRAEMLRGFIGVFHKTDRDVEKYLVDLYEQLPEKWQEPDFLDNLKKIKVPAKGDVLPLADLRPLGKFKLPAGKKYYLFVFYSSDCPHCQKAIPWAYKHLKNRKDIAVLAVGLETEPEHWKQFVAPYTGWQHIAAFNNDYNRIVQAYGIEYTPTWFLTDAKLKILETVTGDKEFKKVLRYFGLLQ